MTESITDVHTVSLVVAAVGAMLEVVLVPYGAVTNNWVPAGLDGVLIALGLGAHVVVSNPPRAF